MDEQRDRVEEALEEVEQAAAAGELDLEMRAAEVAHEQQARLDKLTEETTEALTAARKEVKDVAVLRESIEKQQMQCTEQQLIKLYVLLDEAQSASEAANAALAEVMSKVVKRTTALAEARASVQAADERLATALTTVTTARERLSDERAEFGQAAVEREEQASEMADVAAEQARLTVDNVQLQLSAAHRKAQISKQLGHQMQERSAETAIKLLTTRLTTAEARKVEVDAQAATAAEAVEAAIHRKMQTGAMAAKSLATVADATAKRAEAEAKNAIAKHASVAKEALDKGYASSETKRQVEQARQVERAAVSKATRKREEARTAVAEAERQSVVAKEAIEERVARIAANERMARKEAEAAERQRLEQEQKEKEWNKREAQIEAAAAEKIRLEQDRVATAEAGAGELKGEAQEGGEGGGNEGGGGEEGAGAADAHADGDAPPAAPAAPELSADPPEPAATGADSGGETSLATGY